MNIHFRIGRLGIAPQPFDGGEAGWGIDATDIRDVDVCE